MKLRIAPCLWFDDNAEQAVEHYISIFDNSKIISVSRYGDSGPGEKGSVMMIAFELDGLRMLALNGGPIFQFSEAISMSVSCADQKEVDYYWERLVDGGTPGQCGWLKDKFGLSWQVVPQAIERIMTGEPAGVQRAMEALMGMSKLDVEELERVSRG
jgi:predicted 3-demethylubiquinone-9 3-methyltransferase (glyoxalase superfamily)